MYVASNKKGYLPREAGVHVLSGLSHESSDEIVHGFVVVNLIRLELMFVKSQRFQLFAK